jgi:lipopolysaccharide/colanic/teichoic acid biosynthesis glycosyltransferase
MHNRLAFSLLSESTLSVLIVSECVADLQEIGMFQMQNLIDRFLNGGTEDCGAGCAYHKSEKMLPEWQFKKILYNERKRTERSKNPFTVVFIDVSKFIDKLRGQRAKIAKVVEQLCEIAGSCTRGTDFLGWYECNRVFSIILTDTESTASTIVVQKVKEKIEETQGRLFEGEIEIAALTFPLKDTSDTSSLLFSIYPNKRDSFSEKLFLSIKRMIDIAGGIGGVLFFSPFFLIIPFLIKADSNGPVFYKQKRVGEGGVIFDLYKFRSMHINTSESIHRNYVSSLIKGSADSEKGVYKIKNDPRVTRVGKFLRKLSIDELPQFINVIKGNMSLVGPRPPIPYETAEYELWHLRRVMECKPGLTGIWQVEGRSKTNFNGMVRMDLEYIKKRSLLLDFKIILKTPWALLTAKGAF